MSDEIGSDRVLLRVIMRGLVQGVGFRAWTQHQAELHGVDGWVRNLRDGSVEAMLAGPSDRIEIMLKVLREGPQGSRVDAVEEYPASADEFGDGPREGFAIGQTG